MRPLLRLLLAATFAIATMALGACAVHRPTAHRAHAAAIRPPPTPTTVPASSSPPPVAAPAPATSTASWPDPVSIAERAAWTKVADCEEGGNWHVQGPVYSGGLGISEQNWIAYGGQRDFGPEWGASEDQQIVVAMRIQPDPPDQYGCAPW